MSIAPSSAAGMLATIATCTTFSCASPLALQMSHERMPIPRHPRYLTVHMAMASHITSSVTFSPKSSNHRNDPARRRLDRQRRHGTRETSREDVASGRSSGRIHPAPVSV
jgi:hypothetical protein